MSVEFDYKGKPTQPHIEPPKRRPQFVSPTVMLVWLESFEDHIHFPIGECIHLINIKYTIDNTSGSQNFSARCTLFEPKFSQGGLSPKIVIVSVTIGVEFQIYF